MRKGRLTKVMAMGLVCSMAFLSACGKKDTVITEGGDRPATAIDTDHVYSFENIEFSEGDSSNINRVCASKDSLYACVYSYGSGEGGMKIYKMPFETGVPEEINIGNSAEVSLDNITCDDDGNLYAIKYVYFSDDEDAVTFEDEEESESPAGDVVYSEEGAAEASGDQEADESEDEESSEDTFEEGVEGAEYDDYVDNDNAFMTKISPEGETLWETKLTQEDRESYVRTMTYVKGLGVLTSSEAGICLYNESDGEGSVFSKREKKQEDYYDSYLFRIRNDDVYLFTEEDGVGSSVKKLNADKTAFEDSNITLPEGVYGGYDLYAGKSYDFYDIDNGAIFAFNLGDEKTTKIVDFTASNEIVNMLSFIGEVSDGRLVIATSDNDEATVSFLTKVDPADIKEKEVITLGTVYISDAVRKQVVKFNRASDKYKINIVDYADLAGEEGVDDNEDTYMTGINKMSLDITQGKAPDIILVESNMPFESYAAKGAIEPLEPYFDTDEEISATDFLQNVLDATKVQGHMYSIIPSFSVTTCVAARDNTSGEVVTLDNYKDICAKCGIDPEIGMGVLTKSDAHQLYETIGSAYINYEDGTCSFDSDSFIRFLEFVKELPEDDEDYDYEKYESYYRENKSLLKTYWLSSFEDYQVLKKGYFGKDIDFNGFPTAKDGRSYINPNIQISMSSDCKYKQAAWEFMKSFLTDEYQQKIEWSFPVEKKAIEALAKKAQEKPYYIDANGEKVEHSAVWSIGGMDVEIGELSEQETQSVVDFIESVTNTESSDENVINIIEEEAAAFYEGQKSAEEVADIIQSRVSIYLSEQM